MTMGSSESDDVFVSGFLIGDGHVVLEKRDDGVWIKATKLITSRVADAVQEGRKGREGEPSAPVATAEGSAEAKDEATILPEEAAIQAPEPEPGLEGN